MAAVVLSTVVCGTNGVLPLQVRINLMKNRPHGRVSLHGSSCSRPAPAESFVPSKAQLGFY